MFWWRMFFLLLMVVLKYGNQTRAASNIFKETQCIYLGSNIGTLMFIAFGVIILFTTDYTAEIAARGFGTLTVILVIIVLLFGPKMRAVYSVSEAALDAQSEKDRQMSTQYATNLRERTGKELMLVMNTLLAEMKFRFTNKMMTIELDQNFENLVSLGHDLKKSLTTPSLKDIKQLSSSSDLEADKLDENS